MFFSKNQLPNRHSAGRQNELKRQIELSKTAILSAQNQFEQVVDPTLVDCYIYEAKRCAAPVSVSSPPPEKRELQEV